MARQAPGTPIQLFNESTHKRMSTPRRAGRLDGLAPGLAEVKVEARK